jgi:hypothetical protein
MAGTGSFPPLASYETDHEPGLVLFG